MFYGIWTRKNLTVIMILNIYVNRTDYYFFFFISFLLRLLLLDTHKLRYFHFTGIITGVVVVTH